MELKLILSSPLFWFSFLFAMAVLAWLYYETKKHNRWKESRQDRMARLKQDAMEKIRAENSAQDTTNKI